MLNSAKTAHHTALIARAAEICKSRDVVLTSIRRDVLSLLAQQENGLKAYELLEKIKLQRPNAAPPTVYRALDFLVAQGLVHKLELLSSFVVCRHESHQLPGLFLVCTNCRKVTEWSDASLATRLMDAVSESGHQFNAREVEIATICPQCSQQQGCSSA